MRNGVATAFNRAALRDELRRAGRRAGGDYLPAGRGITSTPSGGLRRQAQRAKRQAQEARASGLALASVQARSAALRTVYPPNASLTQDEIAAAHWCYANGEPAGMGAQQFADMSIVLQPIHTSDGAVAVVALKVQTPDVVQRTGFRRLIGSICRLAAVHRRVSNYEVYADVTDKLPLVNVDFALIERVLVNVIDNAAKYSPGGASIQITAKLMGEDLAIDVTDQGRGSAVQDLGAVFDKFHRVRARDRTVAGTGLGLAIGKGIVEAHGGSIEALSEGLGRGTMNRIRLPVKRLKDAELEWV